VLLGLQVHNHVIATGGSAAYSQPAMEHLSRFGAVVFLDVPFDVLIQRVTDLESRGIAAPPGTTFKKLYEERVPLYRAWADITVTCGCRDHEQLVEELAAACGM
jgi:shikimate kinase